MAKKPAETFLKNPWTIGIGTIVIGYFITSAITAAVRNQSIPSSLWMVLKWIGNMLWSFLTLGVPLWIILVGILLLVVIARFAAIIRESQPEPWRSYRMDYIRNWLFVWDYSDDSIHRLQTICAKCKCQLSRYNVEHEEHLYCPNCSKKYEFITDRDLSDVKKIIVNRIAAGDYIKSPYFKKMKKQSQ